MTNVNGDAMLCLTLTLAVSNEKLYGHFRRAKATWKEDPKKQQISHAVLFD